MVDVWSVIKILYIDHYHVWLMIKILYIDQCHVWSMIKILYIDHYHVWSMIKILYIDQCHVWSMIIILYIDHHHVWSLIIILYIDHSCMVTDNNTVRDHSLFSAFSQVYRAYSFYLPPPPTQKHAIKIVDAFMYTVFFVAQNT